MLMFGKVVTHLLCFPFLNELVALIKTKQNKKLGLVVPVNSGNLS